MEMRQSKAHGRKLTQHWLHWRLHELAVTREKSLLRKPKKD